MWKFLRMLAWASVLVGSLIGVLRLTAIRWWQIPSPDPYLEASIAPTLRGGDWVILWRATAPSYGALTVCPDPSAPGRAVIGRILGEHGDHIKVVGDRVSVNEHTLMTEGPCDKFLVTDPNSGAEVEEGCGRETVGGGEHLRGNAAAEDGVKPADLNIPTGQVFLASDNRRFPWDSREFGAVDRSGCAETIIFRLMSKDGFFDVPNRLMLIH